MKKLLLITTIFLLTACFNNNKKVVLKESLLINTVKGCATLIAKGTELPASLSETVSNASADQPEMTIELFQGESKNEEENRKIGRFDILFNSSATEPGESQIQLTFMINKENELRLITHDFNQRC